MTLTYLLFLNPLFPQFFGLTHIRIALYWLIMVGVYRMECWQSVKTMLILIKPLTKTAELMYAEANLWFIKSILVSWDRIYEIQIQYSWSLPVSPA